ncbi:hypothetical protein MalM25_25100 [Planctomycetes bacterium MalM25]|nr:hypothetical protein MalM25_25100 [Planctomycetes bacterium MalM25]
MLKLIGRWTLASLLVTPLLVGCGGSDTGGSDLDAMADLLDDKVEADAETAAADAVAASQAEVDALQAKADALKNEAPSEISVHDMQRGSALEGGGAASTMIRGGIAAEQKYGMINVQKATQIFWGLESRWPKDHAEFMEKVIEFNQIKLEPLKEPYEYYYDAELNQQLPLKRPKPEAIEAAQAAADKAKAALQE